MQQVTERRPPERPGLIRRLFLGELPSAPMEQTYEPAPQAPVTRPAGRPRQGLAPSPPDSEQRAWPRDIMDIRPITEPDVSMIYFRLERLETGTRLIVETMKRAYGDILDGVDRLRDESAGRPTASEIEWSVRQALEPLAVAVHQLTESVSRPIVYQSPEPTIVRPPAPEPSPSQTEDREASMIRHPSVTQRNGSERPKVTRFPGEDAAQRLRQAVSSLEELSAENGIGEPDLATAPNGGERAGEPLRVQPFDLEPVEREFASNRTEPWKANGEDPAHDG
jgi:hypothetical protein